MEQGILLQRGNKVKRSPGHSEISLSILGYEIKFSVITSMRVVQSLDPLRPIFYKVYAEQTGHWLFVQSNSVTNP